MLSHEWDDDDEKKKLEVLKTELEPSTRRMKNALGDKVKRSS